MNEDLVAVRAVNKALEEEREGAHRRHETLALDHGALQVEYNYLLLHYNQLRVRANRAFVAIADARESYLGRGVLPWLRRRFTRFSGFDDITDRPLLWDHPRGEEKSEPSEKSSDE